MIWWQQKEIIISFIGLISAVSVAIITGLFSKYKNAKAQALQANNEVRFQRSALDFGSFISDWAETHKEISNLLESTPIDRFIMFRAWNGELSPKWTTNVFQMRLGAQEPIQYVHFELDDDYVDRLREIVRNGIIHFKVENIPNSAIKYVYQAEGVKSSVWCHIITETLPGKKSSSHTYCSFATHSDKELSEAVVTKCKIIAGRLKGVAYSYQN